MADYLNVYDLNRQKSAVLQNAFEITETQELNKIYTLDFKIPADDPKIQFLQPFHYVRYGDTGQLYRTIKSELEDSDTPILSVNCEHVIATLVDDLMFGAFQYGGGTVKTADVIRWLLGKQKTANWVLAECDFVHRYEYNWEQENILNALYSIPKEFTKAYKWTFNTSGYPWELSLKAIDATIHPEYYIRAKRNLLSSGTAQDFAGICTRIYPLGYGEGVNQLTIKEATVKNIKKVGNVNVSADVDESSTTKYGNTFIQSDTAIVAQYGIKEKVLVDRRFEDANSLFSYGKTMLEGLQTPSMSRSFDVVDLYPLTSQDIDSAEVGKICKMTGDDTIAYITKTERVLDEAGNLTIDLSTKATDVASAIADLADRVRIESVYAQGATQLYQHSKDANATTEKGMIMSLYFPSEMRQINKVLMRLKLKPFRSYSKSKSAYFDGWEVTTPNNEGGTKQFKTSGNDGGSKNFTTSGNDGGINNFETSGNDGGTNNFETTGNDGGSEGLETIEGGKVDTESGEGGAQEGETSVASGGGGISLGDVSVSVSVDIQETEDANWNRTPYTSNTDLNIKVTGNQGAHQHYIDGNSCVASVEPLPQYNYKHTHYFSEGSGSLAYTEYGGGTHSHEAYVDNGEDNGHHHDIPRWTLKHTHPINASGSGSVTVNNSEGSGQTGFSHSHNFKIKAHTHNFSVPDHTHTFNLPNHQHTFNLPNHKHTFNLPNHTHTFDLPNHTHTIEIGQHNHDIVPGIFESGNPTGFTIKVSGTAKATINATSYDNDIVTWLLDSKNQVPRDSWIDVEIIPNDLAYCQCSVFVQGFVQSRGGGNF